MATNVRRASNEINWHASDAAQMARADLEDKYGRKTPKQWKTKLSPCGICSGNRFYRTVINY